MVSRLFALGKGNPAMGSYLAIQLNKLVTEVYKIATTIDLAKVRQLKNSNVAKVKLKNGSGTVEARVVIERY